MLNNMANKAAQVEALWNGLKDNNGNPLSGGKVYTYKAGTTELVNLFLDKDKIQQACNPIILDAQGKALVYADGIYKFAVTLPDDTLLYTLDNLVYNPTDHGIYHASRYGNTYDDAAIRASIEAIDGDNATLLVKNGTWNINADLEIPPNINFRMEIGSVLNIASGIILTINGRLEAGIFQIFSGDGTVSLGAGSVK